MNAARFVAGEEFCVADAIAPLRERPAADAVLSTQALKGERVTIYDRNAALDMNYPGDAWDTPVSGNFGQLKRAKAAQPGLKILPSIGGWTLSDPFYHLAAEPARRATFIASMKRLSPSEALFASSTAFLRCSSLAGGGATADK